MKQNKNNININWDIWKYAKLLLKLDKIKNLVK